MTMEVWNVSTSNLMNTDINKNRNKLMNKLTQFTQTRDNILGVFQKAKQDLEELNKNISVEIADNEARIQTLQRDNASLLSLKRQNASALSFFSKLFKSK